MIAPALEGIGGRYFEDVQEARVVDQRTSDYTGIAAYALEPANADLLWALSVDLLAG